MILHLKEINYLIQRQHDLVTELHEYCEKEMISFTTCAGNLALFLKVVDQIYKLNWLESYVVHLGLSNKGKQFDIYQLLTAM